jgi:C-terminal processing protease CtpA/Prc
MLRRTPFLIAAVAVGVAMTLGASAQETAEAQREAGRAEVLAQVREQEAEALAQAREEQARAREELAKAREEQARARAEAQQRMAEARRELEEAARRVGELSGREGPFFTAMLDGRAMLGIVVEDGDEGVHVTGVTPGGAAADAGVAVGDVITAIDSVTLGGEGSETQRLVEHMRSVDPGQDVVLHVQRDGDAREITVAASEGAPNFIFAGQPDNRVIVGGIGGTPGVAVGPNGAATWIGPNVVPFQRFFGGRWNELELVALTEELGSYFGTSEGLLVVRAPDDDTIGLEDGDVILEIGGRTPTSPEHATRILMSFESGETLTLEIMRRQRRETVEYVIPGNRTPG